MREPTEWLMMDGARDEAAHLIFIALVILLVPFRRTGEVAARGPIDSAGQSPAGLAPRRCTRPDNRHRDRLRRARRAVIALDERQAHVDRKLVGRRPVDVG